MVTTIIIVIFIEKYLHDYKNSHIFVDELRSGFKIISLKKQEDEKTSWFIY